MKRGDERERERGGERESGINCLKECKK